MNTINIIGANYLGTWNYSRTTCRGIILQGDHMLLSYETKNDQWMIPGGGLEGDETDRECCIREVSEETGVLVEPSDCQLEIIEYYGNCKLVNKYFLCQVIGETERKQTRREVEAGMEPRWISLHEIMEIFSKHSMYADTDEMRRGLYLREYTALKELVKL